MVVVGLIGLLSPAIALLLAGVRVRWAALPLFLPLLLAPLYWFHPVNPRVLAFGVLGFGVGLVVLQLLLVVLAVRRARWAPRRDRGEWLRFAAVALAFAVASWAGSELVEHHRRHNLEPFRVPAGGMLPTLIVGDQFFADHRPEALARGDVVLVLSPSGSGAPSVKRVIAMDGDVVQITGHEVTSNGVVLPHLAAPCGIPPEQARGGQCVTETLPSGRRYTLLWGQPWMRKYGPRKLEAGEFFVLGDNRDNSLDSREYGPVTREQILGRAVVIWLSFSDGRLHWSRLGREL